VTHRHGRPGQAEAIEHLHRQRHDLRVGGGIRRPDQFGADLHDLPLVPRVFVLVSEHVRAVAQPHRPRGAPQQRRRHPGDLRRHVGPQDHDAPRPAIGNRVRLLDQARPEPRRDDVEIFE